jgi:hypothetical protein
MVPYYNGICDFKNQEILGLLMLIHAAISTIYYHQVYKLSYKKDLI